MRAKTSNSNPRLSIVHVLRSPVGGLFRHVADLSREQTARGHAVGLIVDSTTGGPHADAQLAALAPHLALGVARLPMRRDPHPADLGAMLRVGAIMRRIEPDVVHGHGAKGALYARVPALLPITSREVIRIYTPHGGSLHYDPTRLKGAAILAFERLLSRRSDAILFESAYAYDRFRAVVGTPPCPVKIIHNGLTGGEFVPVHPRSDAADVLFVGEFRALKGVDVLLEALASLARTTGAAPRAVLVGAGPDRAAFEALAARLGLGDSVTFRDPMPAREAFALGRVLVVPSRAESLPYIVLEAAAAHVPMIASRVGGIPEILGEASGALVAPADTDALASALARLLALEPEARRTAAADLAASVQARFSTARMAEAVLGAYREALATKHPPMPLSGALAPRSPRFGL